MRLSSRAIHQAAEATPQVGGQACAAGANDGLVDLASQIGVDMHAQPSRRRRPSLSALAPADGGGGSVDNLRSWDAASSSLVSLPGGAHHPTMAYPCAPESPALAVRSFSHVDLRTGVSIADADDKPGEATSRLALEKGKWAVLRVPGSDHCLGTWSSELSGPMYTELLKMLRTLTP
eukprot:5605174-Prymnesium_polylepis.1